MASARGLEAVCYSTQNSIRAHAPARSDALGPPPEPTAPYSTALLLPLLHPSTHLGPVVYFVQPHVGGFIKIGYTTDITRRMRQLALGSPVTLALLGVIPARPGLERELHLSFRGSRYRREWFRPQQELRQYILAQCGVLPLGYPDWFPRCLRCNLRCEPGDEYCPDCTHCEGCGAVLEEDDDTVCVDCNHADMVAMGRCSLCVQPIKHKGAEYCDGCLDVALDEDTFQEALQARLARSGRQADARLRKAAR